MDIRGFQTQFLSLAEHSSFSPESMVHITRNAFFYSLNSFWEMFPGAVSVFQNQPQMSFLPLQTSRCPVPDTSKQGPGGQLWWTAKPRVFMRSMWKHAQSSGCCRRNFKHGAGKANAIERLCLKQKREISVLSCIDCFRCSFKFTIPETSNLCVLPVWCLKTAPTGISVSGKRPWSPWDQLAGGHNSW